MIAECNEIGTLRKIKFVALKSYSLQIELAFDVFYYNFCLPISVDFHFLCLPVQVEMYRQTDRQTDRQQQPALLCEHDVARHMYKYEYSGTQLKYLRSEGAPFLPVAIRTADSVYCR
jgi:hypothetical protein